jgi:hypothetical protein
MNCAKSGERRPRTSLPIDFTESDFKTGVCKIASFDPCEIVRVKKTAQNAYDVDGFWNPGKKPESQG